mgnify:CR=1 FL=1
MDAVAFAKQNGYDSAKLVTVRGKETIYEPLFNKEGATVGIPCFIVETDGKFRLTGFDESFEILYYIEREQP